MTTDPVLDRFAEALTSPATPAELSAEAEVVGQMHGLMGPATGATTMIRSIFGHKVAAAATAMVLGASGVAAASGSVPLFSAEEEPAPIEEVVDEQEEVDAVEPAAEISEPQDTEPEDSESEDTEVLPPANEDGVPYGDVLCEDAENHGQYVSGVARDRTIDGPRGQVVSQAAHTDCGKSDDDDDDDADEHDDSDERSDDESDDESDDDADDRDDDADDDADDRDDDADDDESDDDDDRRGRGNGNGKGAKADR